MFRYQESVHNTGRFGGARVHSEMSRQAHTENCRRRIEEEKTEAARSRVKENHYKAAERSTKRTQSSPKEGRTDVPTTTSSSTSSSNVAPASSSSGSSDAARTGSSGEQWIRHKRKADGEHLEDAEREDGQWMRTEGNKRKTVEEQEESMLRKTVMYLKTLERAEAKKDSEETQEVVELGDVEVNEEEVQFE